MTDLIDRISGESEPGRPKINLHRWIGTQRLYALGEWTRSVIGSEFDIVGFVDEERQAGQIADAIDGASPAINKMTYVSRVEAIFYCVEDREDRLYHNPDGSLNKVTVLADLLIAG